MRNQTDRRDAERVESEEPRGRAARTSALGVATATGSPATVAYAIALGQDHCGGREARDELEAQRGGVRLDRAARLRGVAVRASGNQGSPRCGFDPRILLISAKKNPVESPHMRIPVRPSTGPRKRHPIGSSTSP